MLVVISGTTSGKLHRVRTDTQPLQEPPDTEPPLPAEARENSVDSPDVVPAEGNERDADERLFTVVVIGVMALLLLCVIVILIASRRPPAGL